MEKMQGVICVMCTPYKSDESVDYNALKFNMKELVKKKIGGILVNGGTSEFASLTEDERYKCAELAAKELKGKIPFAVGVTAESTIQVIKYTQHAKSVGADAVMLAAPTYFKPDREMILSHFKKVSKAVDIPIIIYNNPGTVGIDIDLDLSIELLKKVKNAIYYKESSGSLQRARDIKLHAPKKTVMICGCDDLAMEQAFAGCEGWISVIANFAPDLCVELYKLAGERDWEGASAVYSKMLPALSMLEGAGPRMCQVTKYAMDLVGFKGAFNRSPRMAPNKEEKIFIESVVRKLGLIK